MLDKPYVSIQLLQYIPRAKDLETKSTGDSFQLLTDSTFCKMFINIKGKLKVKYPQNFGSKFEVCKLFS